LEAELEARAKPVKYNSLFSDCQENSRKPKQLNNNVQRVDSSEKEYEFFDTECAKPYSNIQSPTKCSHALNEINVPTTFATDSATSMLVATAPLVKTLMISRL
jgi:hypothetical protein